MESLNELCCVHLITFLTFSDLVSLLEAVEINERLHGLFTNSLRFKKTWSNKAVDWKYYNSLLVKYGKHVTKLTVGGGWNEVLSQKGKQICRQLAKSAPKTNTIILYANQYTIYVSDLLASSSFSFLTCLRIIDCAFVDEWSLLDFVLFSKTLTTLCINKQLQQNTRAYLWLRFQDSDSSLKTLHMNSIVVGCCLNFLKYQSLPE